MKTAGILGGMSWESTAHYYQWLNEGVRNRLGGLHSARILMSSVDFAIIERMQAEGAWDRAGEALAREARALERAGADFILLATNTMHKVASVIESSIAIPFLHIADATAERVKAEGVGIVGLMATIYTMEQDFYTGRLRAHGIDVIVPEDVERREVNRIIYEELCLGKVKQASRQIYRDCAQRLFDRGAQGLILGCTEISMLINESDFDAPVFDTTRVHVEAALDRMLKS